MGIKFKKGRENIEIIDPIERHHEQIITPNPVVIDYTEWDQTHSPVDSAIKITTDQLTFPNTGLLNIRGEKREIISEVKTAKNVCLPKGNYILEISKSIKIYIHVESELYIKSSKSEKTVKLKEQTEVIIGARSYHTQPAGTITTTSSPTDVMQAVSTFGSALKTSRPERSYPTLRGHPPLIELGDELEIPTKSHQSDTSIQIEIPPRLDYIYSITPLVYYLRAELIPGSEPCLITKNGFSFGLNESDEFESTIGRILRKVFFLDCVVRTEGNSPGSLYERKMIESELKFDFSTVYNQSPSERIETYLEVPFSQIDSKYPKWNPRTTIKSSKENVEFLPFIAESLSIVSTSEGEDRHPSTKQTRSNKMKKPSVSRGQTNDSKIQQNWECNGDINVESTTPLTAFYNNINRESKEGPLDIEVICNDTNMSAELVTAHSAYGNRNELPFNVTIHHNLTKKQLKNRLESESDFTHYIGHIDKDGLRCSDGNLDASSLNDVKSKVFFLNACHSHDQGIELVKAGSIGGIVTYNDIQNNHAVDIGSTIARLLNLGYPLYATVDIARMKSSAGEQYHIVGDGSTSIAQSKTTVPNSCLITQEEDGASVIVNLYSSKESKKGCIFHPNVNSIEEYHLVQQNITPRPITKAELIKFLDINPIPVIIDGSIYWSDNINISDIDRMIDSH